jgi:hypothetical protein
MERPGSDELGFGEIHENIAAITDAPKKIIKAKFVQVLS